MSSSSFCIFWKKFSLFLCLNVFGLLADFKQMEDYFIFLARGMISIFVQKYFCEIEVLNLRVIRPWLAGWNISAL